MFTAFIVVSVLVGVLALFIAATTLIDLAEALQKCAMWLDGIDTSLRMIDTQLKKIADGIDQANRENRHMIAIKQTHLNREA